MSLKSLLAKKFDESGSDAFQNAQSLVLAPIAIAKRIAEAQGASKKTSLAIGLTTGAVAGVLTVPCALALGASGVVAKGLSATLEESDRPPPKPKKPLGNTPPHLGGFFSLLTPSTICAIFLFRDGTSLVNFAR